jgi:predicted NAD/FAD-binding protein
VGERIAIVGSGISGLGAAWALHEDHAVTVFETDSRVGGHSNTLDVPTDGGVVPVDTGFIVYNEVTYPNLTRLFDTLGVATETSDMSFSFSLDGQTEYGASLRGVLAQPSNLARPRFVRMLADIDRFRRVGASLRPHVGETIGSLLVRHGFGDGFRHDYLYPMTGAIWSASQADISRYPAASVMRFLGNHGLVEIVGRPRWRTVTGGSRRYVQLLTAGFRDRIYTNTPVTSVVRAGGDVFVTAGGSTNRFDQVVFASHSDQALRILGVDATSEERGLLGAIRYQPNVAVLHGDSRLMPRRRRVWSSWNAMATSRDRHRQVASVTYWMNRLQNLDPSLPLFVSLNPLTEPDPDLVYGRFEYAHPSFDQAAVDAQTGIAAIQGQNNTWFAGAYLGYGFHEDGLQSGLSVAAALGSPAPWHGEFEPVSSSPLIPAVAA